MKPHSVALPLLLSLSIPVFADPVPANSVTVGSVSFPVAFEDSRLTGEARQFISEELEAFFSYANNLADCFPENWSEGGYRNYYGSQFIHTETDFDRGLGYTNTPTPELHVFQRFTNRYRLDGEEYAIYTNLHDSAVQFVAALNDGSVTNCSVVEKRELFIILPEPPSSWTDAEICRNLEDLVKEETYFPPTFFDFRLEHSAPPLTNAIPCIRLKSRKQGESAVFDIPIIHVNGCWRFLDIVE